MEVCLHSTDLEMAFGSDRDDDDVIEHLYRSMIGSLIFAYTDSDLWATLNRKSKLEVVSFWEIGSMDPKLNWLDYGLQI
ncbi:hypothetical protein Tco_0780403 [Tanacetum coccineum]